MIASSFADGIRALRARPGLAALLFLAYLIAALILSIPLFVLLDSAVSTTGFDADLFDSLDIVLLTDIFETHPGMFSILVAQIVWIVPVLFLWKTAVGVGLVHALRDGGARAFWSGVSRYFGRGALLGLLYVLPVVALGFVVMLVSLIGPRLFTGEAASYYLSLWVIPTLAITGLSIIDLMHDYGRMALVIDEKSVTEAFIEGIRFPFRHGAASWLYIAWFIPAALLWLLPTFAELWIGAGLLGFLLQQIVLLGRSATTVAWFGSQVSLFQTVRRAESPLIAAETSEEAAETPVGFA